MPTYEESFDEARKFYPGVKRGLSTEFANFRKKHKDWREALPLLKPAIEKQMSLKSWKEGYIPHFQTWINQRQWEFEIPIKVSKAEVKPCCLCGKPATIHINTNNKDYCSTECRQKGEGW